MEVFTPKHPYLPKGCGNCTRKLLLSYNPESDKCKGCAIITKQAVIEGREKATMFMPLEDNQIIYNNLLTSRLHKANKPRKRNEVFVYILNIVQCIKV